MRVDVVRCASCNTIVDAPSVRSRGLVCEGCTRKARRSVCAGAARQHHVPQPKEGPDDDGNDHDDSDDDPGDSLLDHWPC